MRYPTNVHLRTKLSLKILVVVERRSPRRGDIESAYLLTPDLVTKPTWYWEHEVTEIAV